VGEFEGFFTILCEKDGYPTLKFVFKPYYNHDMWVEKFIDNVKEDDYSVILTWNDF